MSIPHRVLHEAVQSQREAGLVCECSSTTHTYIPMISQVNQTILQAHSSDNLLSGDLTIL